MIETVATIGSTYLCCREKGLANSCIIPCCVAFAGTCMANIFWGCLGGAWRIVPNCFPPRPKPSTGPPAGGIEAQAEHLTRISTRIQTLTGHQMQHKALAIRQKKAGNTQGALRSLKQAKILEKTIMGLDAQLGQLQIMYTHVDGAKTNKDTIQVMKDGAQYLKDIQKTINVDEVHETMDDVSEVMSDMRAVNDAMSLGFTDAGGDGFYGDIDDDDLEEELRLLDEQDSESIANSTKTSSVQKTYPNVTTVQSSKTYTPNALTAPQAIKLE